MKSIGTNIRRIRERKGFSQEFVAHELGINQSTYGKIERNEINLHVDRLIKIAEILEENLTSFLDISSKNTFNNQNNRGNGYVETIYNDNKALMDDLKFAYDKVI